MPTRIRILEWIILHIRIAVQALRIAGTGHDRIRADEPANQGIVIPRIVVIQTQVRLEALPRKLVVGRQGAAARLPVGIVAHFTNYATAGIRRQGRAA